MTSSVWLHRVRRGALTAFLTIVAATCSGSPTAPPTPKTGAIKATVQTSGSDQDPNGYVLSLDQGSPESVSDNGTVLFSDVSTGSHSVALDSVASNCTVSDSNPRSVTVSGGDTVTVAFSVTCSAQTGALRIASATSGSKLDSDGYAVVVDSGAVRHLAVNDTLVIDGLAAADHTVELDSVASNCTVSGSNPRTVTVPAQDTAATTFTVSCSSLMGDLHVTTSTSGSNKDPDGYALSVDGGPTTHMAIDDSLTLQGLAAGSHTVQLDSVEANCSVAGGTVQNVSVPDGGTVTAAFNITCSASIGNIKVKAPTTGVDADTSYQVTLDGTLSQPLPANDSVMFNNVSVGTHSIALSGVAGNCSVSSSNPQNVDVAFDSTSTATFDVSCVSLTGDIKVRTQTSGTDLDPDGYTIILDGGSTTPIAVNDSITYDSLTAGPHTIRLGNVANNCTVSGANPMTVDAPHGGVTDTAFVVNCAANVGDIQVSNTTTGSNLDASYTVTLDGATSQTLARNSSVTFSNVSVGSHEITLSGVAENCGVVGSNPDTVAVTFNGTTKPNFTVNCVAPLSGKIAFETTRNGPFQVYLMNTDGSGQTPITNTSTDERLPAISPDGNLIAIQSKRSGEWDIWVMLNDGTAPVDVTNGGASRHPAWSPDGTMLAFDKQTSAGQHLYIINRDGTGLKLITDLTHTDSDPNWSPDGTKIAFVRDSLGNGEIYTIDAGGVGSPTNLTQDSASNDFNPEYSPDGSQIVFASDRLGRHGDIYIMSASGGVQTQLTTDSLPDFAPTYSRDGTYIYFTSDRSGTSQIWRMTASCVASISSDPQACENTLVRITNDGFKDDNASMSP